MLKVINHLDQAVVRPGPSPAPHYKPPTFDHVPFRVYVGIVNLFIHRYDGIFPGGQVAIDVHILYEIHEQNVLTDENIH